VEKRRKDATFRGGVGRGVHKLRRAYQSGRLQEDRISAPHGVNSNSTHQEEQHRRILRITLKRARNQSFCALQAPSFGDLPASATLLSKGRRFRISLEIRYDRIYEPNGSRVSPGAGCTNSARAAVIGSRRGEGGPAVCSNSLPRRRGEF
jgi:hypothetical protein